MSKSLTETAKAILEKKMLAENANADTLKPKSKHVDPGETLGSATKIADAPVKPGEGNNVGAAAAVKGKDTSAPTKNANPAEPPQKLSEDEELEEEEVLLPEELTAFIDNLVAEGASEEDILAAIEENFEFSEEEEVVSEETVEEENCDDDDDKDSDDDSDKDLKEAIKIDISEHIEALFQGEELSEDFKDKATTIFEAAINAKIMEEVAKLEEQFAAKFEEEIVSIKEELTSNVDDYMNYVVEQWVSDNEVAIEAGLRTELTEDFIAGLRNLFSENYIDIPDDKISVVEELGTKVEELEEKLNEEIQRNVELNKTLNEAKKSDILHTVVEGLTATQAEKLKSLAENVAFTTDDEFASKMKTLRESYFPENVKSQSELDTIEPGTEGKSMIAEDMTSQMAKYVKALPKKVN